MKRSYQKPVMEMETFAPNEYIAACYALVDVNDDNHYVIKQGWNGNPTDGRNSDGSKWNGLGFGDDHLDVLSRKYGESYNGSDDTLYYNGDDMNHTETVSAWEGMSNGQKNMVDYKATPVRVVTLTDGNQYGSSANAS